MKVIDLLNKIANGEEVPKKIKWGEFELEWEELGFHDYKFLGTGNHLLFQGFATSVLNDEVEIIEEKKIKRLQSCGDNLYSEYIGQWLVNKENYTEYDELLMNKINEIIDYINKEK